MNHLRQCLDILLAGSITQGGDCITAHESLGGGNSIEGETGLWLYAHVRRAKPRVVVQTGTHWGFSAAWIAAALADNYEDYPQYGPGHLWTVDIHNEDDKTTRCKELWERLGLTDFITFDIADSRTWEVPEAARPIDFLALDADHTTQAVLDEWEHFRADVFADESYIWFHDTISDPREAIAVRQIVQQEWNDSRYEFVQVCQYPQLRGMDLLYLRRDDPY